MTKLEQAARQALEALEMYNEHGAILRPLETTNALREALTEQAEQEPVAYVLWDDNNVPSLQWEKPNDGVFNQLYYAAPVRTKDLTDDEILEITKRFALGIAFPVDGVTTPEMFARAVIAADREKNK